MLRIISQVILFLSSRLKPLMPLFLVVPLIWALTSFLVSAAIPKWFLILVLIGIALLVVLLNCILVGGVLSNDLSYFKSFKKKFFLHVKVLSAVFKGKFLEGLKRLYIAGDLDLPYALDCLSNPDSFQSFLDSLYVKDWVVFSKSVFKCASHVIKYLGRYTHRVAISDYRIKDFTNDQVTFSYQDNKDGGKQKVMTLSCGEFMRRFLLHVLPHRFVKIRHYGFLSNRFRSKNVALCRRFIAKQRGLVLKIIPSLDKFNLLLKIIGKDKLCCPNCGNFYTYTHEVNLN